MPFQLASYASCFPGHRSFLILLFMLWHLRWSLDTQSGLIRGIRNARELRVMLKTNQNTTSQAFLTRTKLGPTLHTHYTGRRSQPFHYVALTSRCASPYTRCCICTQMDGGFEILLYQAPGLSPHNQRSTPFRQLPWSQVHKQFYGGYLQSLESHSIIF